MLVKFPARFFDRLVSVTTGRRGAHDLFDLDLGSKAVSSRHAAAHITLGDGSDQLELFLVLDDRRAAAA